MAYVDLNPIRAGIAATRETSDFTCVKERIEDRTSAGAVSTPDAQDMRIEHGEKGCLSMTLDQYLRLLDWTGRQIRKDKVGVIPQDCAPILDRLDCSAETWVDFVKNFRKRFRNEAGLPKARQDFRTTRRESRSSLKAF